MTVELNPDDRQQLWQAVQQAQAQGLPKTAAKTLDQIFDLAVQDKAYDEAAKAVCYRIRVLGRINQPETPYALREVEKILPRLSPDVQPMVQFIQAHWFLEYYYQNQWKFANRSRTAAEPSDDFETWDLPRLLDKIDALLQASLANSEKLKSIPIAQFDQLLEPGTLPDTYQPTAYDFIAFQSIKFYALNEQITRGQDDFEVSSDSPIFANTNEFLAWQPETTDTKSPELRAIKVCQQWIRFHADDDDPTARLNADLTRIRLGNQVAVGDQVQSRYRAALQRFADAHVQHELSASALALQAQSLQADDQLQAAHKAAAIGMQRFPDSAGGKTCFNIFHSIQSPQISLFAEQVWNGDDTEIQITYKNLNQVYFRLVRYDFRKANWGRHGRAHGQRVVPAEAKKAIPQPVVAAWSAELPPTPDFKSRTQAVPAQVNVPAGCYLLLSSLNEDFDSNNNQLSGNIVWVSDINLVTRESRRNAAGQVLHARSGQPIAGAKVTMFRWRQDGKNSREELVGTTVTDQQGKYQITSPAQSLLMTYIQHDDQVFGITDYQYRRGRSRQRTQQQTFFFTDRSIYRPGQTINFKGVCVRHNSQRNDYQVLAGQSVTVQLVDTNGQSIEQRTFRANDLGSFAGSFTVPRDRGTGQMRLNVLSGPRGATSFRVEEYKRPKFFVKVDRPTQQVRLEQAATVKVRATGYTGAPVDGAKVTWRVVRSVRYPQWWYWRCWNVLPVASRQEIADGTGTTSVDGDFSAEFLAKPDRSIDRESEPVFVYTIYADVTDTTGETRSAQQTVKVGYTSMTAELTTDSWLTTEAPVEFKLSTETLDGEGLAATGKLTVYRLKQPQQVQRAKLLPYYRQQPLDQSDFRSWPVDEPVHHREVTTTAEGLATTAFELTAGAYKTVFETTDQAGQKVIAEYPFQVLDPKAKNMPVRIANHVSAKSWSVEPGEELMAVWGTGYDSGRAFVEIEHRQKVVQAYWTDADRTQQPIRFKVTEQHRGGFQVRVTYIRENRAYLTTRPVEVPWSNKDLKIKWEHFVSKLTPGGKETWTAVISGPDAQAKGAEFVAAMYDASLDAFTAHRWNNSIKSLFYRDYGGVSLRYYNHGQPAATFIHNLNTPSKSQVTRFRRLDSTIVNGFDHWADFWYGFGGNRRWGGGFGGGGAIIGDFSIKGGGFGRRPLSRARASAGQGVALEMSSDNGETSDSDFAYAKKSKDSVAGESLPDDTPEVNLEQVSVRQNLQETAFFYPQLKTGDDGSVRIEFTVPEALTEWKFMGFAHDSQLRTGLLTDKVTTSKDLMVQPNPPRFLREGDQLEFSVKVVNRGQQSATGQIRLALTDAATTASLDADFGNGENQQAFDVPAGQSKSYFWKIKVPDYVGVIAWRAVGATDSLSDGEEGLLPVLSRRILVVESLPLPIRGNQTKTFEFDNLEKIDNSDSLESQSLTIQMTSNPSWYAILSLPYLMEYPHQCNEQVFNRLYANALGQHIVNSDPKIKRVFDQWAGTPALDSPLEKNEDILNVMIAETPWLRDAKNESQARRDVAVLFDTNRMTNELRRANQQLAQSQNSDGSWSWFPGGPANDFITLYITTGFGRLRHLGVRVDQQVALRSLNRMDNWINTLYRRLKQDKKLAQNNLGAIECLYLYGRSFYLADQAISDQNREAVDYFLAQAKQHWLKVGKLSQGQLAVACQRFGDRQTPTAILKSLTQRSQSSEELGRFWLENDATWWWYRAPIETQAMLIEAYAEVANDSEAVEECKIWLLKQKQTQSWKTTKATADAVYALLLQGTNQLASSQLVEVSLGGQTVQPTTAEAGTGFYSEVIAGGDVHSGQKSITVKKTDDGIAWGSVNWKYLEDVAKITPHQGTPLKLQKSLYVKRNTKSGPTITPIDGPVNVGDEVVTRVEVRVDRDMEYVHLKDQRGSGTEPVNVLSRYKNQDGLWYYESTRDTASHFFIDYLRRGTYVFEYSVRVQHRGQYQSGIATLQCMYAPEFNSHSNSVAIEVQ